MTKNTFVCEKHFENKYIYITRTGQKRLKWDTQPVPSVFSFPDSVKTPIKKRRKSPTKRYINLDEMDLLLQRDRMDALTDIRYVMMIFRRDWILGKCSDHYRLYQLSQGMPQVLGAIVIDSSLHVQLSYKGLQSITVLPCCFYFLECVFALWRSKYYS